MRKRLPWILLSVSALLNVGFVAGFLYSASVLRSLQTPEGRVRYAAKQLKLGGEKRKAIEEIDRQWRSRLRQVLRENEADIEAFWSEMIRENPDRAKIREILDRLLLVQNETTREGVATLERAFTLLTPEQRRQFAKLLRDRARGSG